MPYDNSENTAKGRLFQEQVRQALEKAHGIDFFKDYPLSIGNPPKEHKFDLVSANGEYVVECKNYSWTEAGNIPDAKMAKCDQALLYLSYAPPRAKRLLVMRKDTHLSKEETLAQYFRRTHLHLLSGVSVAEFDLKSGTLSEL